MPDRWPIEIASPLGKDEALERLRAEVEPWAGPSSKHVGAGGRYLYGDHGAAKRFEGEVIGDRFALQRIHYRGQSKGPRMWSEGEARETATGSVIGLRHRPRAETWVFFAVWTSVLAGLAAFGAYLGFGDRLPAFLTSVGAILALGYGFLAIGVIMERRICTDLFRQIFDAD